MATFSLSSMQQQQEVVGADDDMYYGDGSEADVDDLQMSGLSIHSSESDASIESSDPKKMKKQKNSASSDDDDEEEDGTITVRHYNGDLSLPGSPAWSSPRRGPESERPAWLKEYASETEARAPGSRMRGGGGESSYYWRNSRRARESRLERTWEMRRGHFSGDGADSHSGGSSPCVVVRPKGRGTACICMDKDEVRACRDLGLECDWTVEIPPAAFQPHPDTSGGGDSPIGRWRTSSPRDDQREVKARLRVWAQAVALASRLGS
ncbi:hypothetical protein Taro_035093 [Colocasia esculenta]|uniref:Uncharacterized protein n=1 Tax=Colocasia esculenta TaxID=4460 RepID=A0A843W2R4_COLES|nr:hypothetical protein [Colocasia esculenta]